MIETSQLQTLLAVAKANSFSKAAEELHVTQSAISQSIKNLEIKLDVRLFKRAGKKVVMTPEGEKLYDLANDFLTRMEDTLEEIKHDKESMSGKVRIGTLTGVGKSWLAPELLELSKQWPELTVAIGLGFQEDLVRDFTNYLLDILVLPEDSLPPIGERLFLSDEKSTLVYPKASNFGITGEMKVEELAALPTVLFELGDPLYNTYCRMRFGRVPKKINVRYVVNSHGNMLQAVSQGLGVAVIPNHVLRRSYYRDLVSTLGPDYEISNGKFYLVHHKESLELQRVRATIDRLLSAGNPLGTGLA